MKVHVVVFGESGQGYVIQGIYSHPGDALVRANEVMVRSRRSFTRLDEWEGPRWEYRGDYVEIFEGEVVGG